MLFFMHFIKRLRTVQTVRLQVFGGRRRLVHGVFVFRGGRGPVALEVQQCPTLAVNDLSDG